ncbi:hypothetical protein PVAND_002744 [Polypedilum vanderplanki]|uniref:Lipid storage droplets surface-binding protein 1 n=1 Tax=Polypedilum vanderplanki TaxID=319348 RepID=A0A9J6BTJ5_POLVA|nr:hypothetical protein PVAND_002744 [Polypedilum vanderplanki]
MVNSMIIHTQPTVRMESFEKFASIPIIESSLNVGSVVYNRVKNSNRLLNWSLNVSENLTLMIFESIKPAMTVVQAPLHKLDSYGVKILDSVESVVPNINLPPQMIYWNTKEYVSDKMVKPVLKRADSFGDIANHALDIADQALDRYLPDNSDSENNNVDKYDGCKRRDSNSAVLTYRKSKILSKKIKSRISTKTAAEITAIKHDVHILIYAMELIVTNPKEAYVKTKELYSYLSLKEPENQKRPETLEELLVLLTREAARKVVHLINFTSRHVGKIPRKLRQTTQEFLHYVLYWSDSLLKMIRIENAQNVISKIHTKYDEVSVQTNNVLERLAVFFSGRLDAEKIQMSNRNRIYMRPTSINGLY